MIVRFQKKAFLLFSLTIIFQQAQATTLTYTNGDFNPSRTIPYVLSDEETLSTLTIIDSTNGNYPFAATSGSYTIRIHHEGDTDNFAYTLTIESGALVTYLGSDTSASTIIGAEYGVTPTPIINYGTISKGNGLNAIKIESPLNAGSFEITNEGSILGPIILNTNDSLIVQGSSPVISGAITGASSTTFTVGNSSSDQFTTGGTISSVPTVTLSNGTFTVGHNITGVTTFTASSGTTLKASGTPTITATTSNLSGTYQVEFSNNTQSGSINFTNALTASSAEGITISKSGYLSSGTYTILSYGSITGTPTITAPTAGLHETTSSATQGLTSVTYNYTRIPFEQTATDPIAKILARIIDQYGADSASNGLGTVLDTLDSTTSVEALNDMLIELYPISSTPLVSKALVSHLMGKAALRLATLRQDSYAAGNYSEQHGFWLRPFFESAIQKTFGTMVGYKVKTTGLVLGYDVEVNPNITIGLAGSYATTENKLLSNSLTYTDITTYQMMLYLTNRYVGTSYLDLILSAGTDNYNGQRRISSLNINADSKYNGQHYSLKAIYSNELIWREIFQFSPIFSAQLSYLRQLPYTETGAGSFNMKVFPENTTVLQVGAGGKVALPVAAEDSIIMPEINFMALADVSGEAQNTTSYFLSADVPIKTTSKPGRMIYRAGAKITAKLSDRAELIANYDLELRKQYRGHLLYINLRYLF